MPQLVWLITGCSPDGLGEVFVKQLLRRGEKVIATARRIEKIKHLEAIGAATLQLDITASQETVNDIFTKAIAIYGRIDVLVNNAGFIVAGTLEDVSDEQLKAQFDTNVFGQFKTMRAVMPHLRQRGTGTIVFISSLSGWIGHAFTGAYAGSKFALEGLVESFSRETDNTNIRTLLIEPGRFRTLFLSPENMTGVNSIYTEYKESASQVLQYLAAEDRQQPGDPDKGVSIILDLVQKKGVAAGKEIPMRFPLGTDCYDEIRGKLLETLRVLDEWGPVMKSTDIEATEVTA